MTDQVKSAAGVVAAAPSPAAASSAATTSSSRSLRSKKQQKFQRHLATLKGSASSEGGGGGGGGANAAAAAAALSLSSSSTLSMSEDHVTKETQGPAMTTKATSAATAAAATVAELPRPASPLGTPQQAPAPATSAPMTTTLSTNAARKLLIKKKLQRSSPQSSLKTSLSEPDLTKTTMTTSTTTATTTTAKKETMAPGRKGRADSALISSSLSSSSLSSSFRLPRRPVRSLVSNPSEDDSQSNDHNNKKHHLSQLGISISNSNSGNMARTKSEEDLLEDEEEGHRPPSLSLSSSSTTLTAKAAATTTTATATRAASRRRRSLSRERRRGSSMGRRQALVDQMMMSKSKKVQSNIVATTTTKTMTATTTKLVALPQKAVDDDNEGDHQVDATEPSVEAVLSAGPSQKEEEERGNDDDDTRTVELQNSVLSEEHVALHNTTNVDDDDDDDIDDDHHADDIDDADPPLEEMQSDVMVDESEEVELLEDNVAIHNADYRMYEDPPLEEMVSEVSVGFDMRSIHDHPLPDNRVIVDGGDQATGEQEEQHTKSWQSYNVIFENMDENKDQAMTSDFEWSRSVADTRARELEAVEATAEEKKEKEAMEVATVPERPRDTSWDTTSQPFPTQETRRLFPQKLRNAVDMFDTTSWAGTDANFSEVSISKVAVNPEVESQFVELMLEEMQTRELTDEERRMLYDAKQRLDMAEEARKAERVAALKDDVPLIGRVASSDECETTEVYQPLEERLQKYEAFVLLDDDSVDEHDSEGGAGAVDEEEDLDDNEDVEVEYVGQEELGDSDDDIGPEDLIETRQTCHENLVPADNVPALKVAAPPAETQSSAAVGSEPSHDMEMNDILPPPPPPGLPKKKKKRRSKSRSAQSVPLLAPPPEDKRKQWEDAKSRAQNYLSALKESNVSPSNVETVESKIEKHSPPGAVLNEINNDHKMSTMSDKSEQEFLVVPSPDEKFHFLKDDDSLKQSYDVDEKYETTEAEAGNEVKSATSEAEESTYEVFPSVESQPDQNVVGSFNQMIPATMETSLKSVNQSDEPPAKSVEKIGNSTAPGFIDDNRPPLETCTSPDNYAGELEAGELGSCVSPDDDAAELVYLGESEFERNETLSDKGTVDVDGSLKVDVQGSIEEEEAQPRLFDTPRSKSSTVFNGTAMRPSSIDTVLPNEAMADKAALASSRAADAFEEKFSPENKPKKAPTTDLVPEVLSRSMHREPMNADLTDSEVLTWFSVSVLKQSISSDVPAADVPGTACSILSESENFNSMCQYIADNVNFVTKVTKSEDVTLNSFDSVATVEIIPSEEDNISSFLERRRPWLKPVSLSDGSMKLSRTILAANYVSFMFMTSKITNVESPFGESNPFLAMVVDSSLRKDANAEDAGSPQQLLFDQLDGRADLLLSFVYKVKCSCESDLWALGRGLSIDEALTTWSEAKDDVVAMRKEEIPMLEASEYACRRSIVPDGYPSPFESCIKEVPTIAAVVLSFVGDPTAVCRMKMLNRNTHQIVAENEHVLMQNAVRIGGMDMSVRPAFWMWITLQKCDATSIIFRGKDELQDLEKRGEDGKWSHVISRDVARSFGNMPPHKTGAKLRNDSIVKALITWGQSRTMKRGVKGEGKPMPTPDLGPKNDRKQKKWTSHTVSSPPWSCNPGEGDDGSVVSQISETPTDTVSDWGAVSPKGSFASFNDADEGPQDKSGSDESMSDMALSGNGLTPDVKLDLQKKLSFILHSLAESHEDIGYCQGMDYVVAHLLRILQETIRWSAAKQTLPSAVSTASALQIEQPVKAENIEAIYREIDENLVVEETVLRVMDTFFMNYNLRHMYWPELRCLKTCCRVFERLIQIKLPVLADHFEHHDLNVGLFALGWFQTLFLYLPSMPSATVGHMWDIWLVERSFKIFFRVATAILFLSQPTLLNHELEGMMTYLNTIPDATLLRADILIPCALNIKVTNRMLQELETAVMQEP